MRVPTILNPTQSDTTSIETELFISFRKSLKKLLRDEYYDTFGEVCDEPLARKIMMSRKNFSSFNGDIAKHDGSLNHITCGVLIANTVFTMFQILCSMQTEFHVKSYISQLAGIVSDAGRGISVADRIFHAVDTIYDVSSKHEIFDVVQDSIDDINTYLDLIFGCEFDYMA